MARFYEAALHEAASLAQAQPVLLDRWLQSTIVSYFLFCILLIPLLADVIASYYPPAYIKGSPST